MSHVGLQEASKTVKPHCARVCKNEECTCALKSCTAHSKTGPDTPSGSQGQIDPETANSNTVTTMETGGESVG